MPNCCDNPNYSNKCHTLLSKLPALLASTDKSHLITKLINIIHDTVDSDHVHIRYIDWDKETLALLAHLDNEYEDEIILTPCFQTISSREALSGHTFSEQDMVLSPNLQDEDLFKNYLATASESASEPFIKFLKSLGSIISQPLLLFDDKEQHNPKKSIGVLNVIRRTGRPKFEERDGWLVGLLANQLALVVRDYWLLEIPEFKSESAQADVDIRDLCLKSLDEATKRTGATDAKIRFIDYTGDFLVPGVSRTPDRFDECSLRRIGSCIAGMAAKDRKPQVAGHLQDHNDFSNFLKRVSGCIDGYEEESKLFKSLPGTLESDRAIILERLADNAQAHDQDSIELRYRTFNDRLGILKKQFQSQADNDELIEKMAVAAAGSALTWKQYHDEHLTKFNSEIAVPIIFGSTLLGVLNLHSKEHTWFNDSDIAIAQRLAEHIATSSIENNRAILRHIQNISQDMTAVRQYGALAEHVYNGTIKTILISGRTNPENIFPTLYYCKTPINLDDSTETRDIDFSDNFAWLERTGVTPDELDLLAVPIRPDGLGKEAIESNINMKAPPALQLIVRERIDDPLSGGSKNAQDKHVKTTAVVPLIHGRVVYGLLYIHIKEHHYFTQLEKELFIQFAGQSAAVIKGIRETGGATYSAEFGSRLFDDSLEYLNNDFKVLDDGFATMRTNILQSPINYATGPIQKAVDFLVEFCDLPADISAFYKAFADDETLLFQSDSYRDHYFHPFNTFQIGYTILKKLILAKQKGLFSGDDKWSQLIDDINNDSTFLKKWIVTSLFHDITYVAEKGPEWLEGFISNRLSVNINAYQNWGPVISDYKFIDAIGKLSARFGNGDQDKCLYFRSWINRQLTEFHDHGILSALFLIREAEQLMGQHQSLRMQMDLIVDCGLAIALHNFHQSYWGDSNEYKWYEGANPDRESMNILAEGRHAFDRGRSGSEKAPTPSLKIGYLKIKEFFLAFLLTYCDTAQEWGRPKKWRMRHKPTDKYIPVTIPFSEESARNDHMDGLRYDRIVFSKTPKQGGRRQPSKKYRLEVHYVSDQQQPKLSTEKLRWTWTDDSFDFSFGFVEHR